jgi:glycosyltransferase involved in cell wall biosynthesis
LSSLKVPDEVQLEVIVVDNNSSDETYDVYESVRNQLSSQNLLFKYVFEQQQGLSHARNTGQRLASGDYILYIDDECILPYNYIQRAYLILSEFKPAMLGGPFYGKFLPDVTSKWYKESFGNSYILDRNLKDGAIKTDFLSGGNMIIRKDVFAKIGEFKTNLGMVGGVIDYGEEQDFQKRLRLKLLDEEIYYYKALYVYHYIRIEKMAVRYLVKDAIARGIYSEKVKETSFFRVITSPILLTYQCTLAITFIFFRLLQSIITRKSFLTLLFYEYNSTRWRRVGGSWFLFKRIISELKVN